MLSQFFGLGGDAAIVSYSTKKFKRGVKVMTII